MAKKIRFAPLIRVSTEQQEQRGESLRVQRKAIESALTTIGGIIPEECEKYSGQEHATSNFERKKFDQLLADSKKGIFDAVIVCDPSRWSRDNKRSKEGLEILRNNGIKFYVGATEYDLYNPQANLFLGMSTEMNEFFAAEQARKSILSRFERASKKQNPEPTSGKLPFGRTFDKKTKEWGIIEEDQKKIVWVAEQYLSGVSMTKIAKTLGMNHSNLWKILNHRSGNKWELNFNYSKLNISETVTLDIPELLPDETIQQIRERAEANKTYSHGQNKNKYLLSRMIFCSECSYAMHGQTNRRKVSYYRHARQRSNPCSCEKSYIAADLVESAVFFQLFSLFGDKVKLDKAIKGAVPDTKFREKVEGEITQFEKELKITRNKKRNLINAIADGVVDISDIKEKMDSLKEQEKILLVEIEDKKKVINDIPSSQQIRERKKRAEKMLMHMKKRRYGSFQHLCKMSWEEKRELVELFLSTKMDDGSRAGVYLKNNGNRWEYEIRGMIKPNINGNLPMSKEKVIELLKLDPENHDAQLNLLGERYAHYCIGVYQ